MTEAELNSFTSGYATQEDGKTKSVSLNRRSDGYFDAVGRVATSSISVAEFIATIGAAWDTSETITWKWGLTEAELTSFAAGYATQEDGVTKSLSINRRSDGYFDAVGREAETEIAVATVTATVGQSWDSVEVTIWKWGLTLAELNAFTATYSAQEDGITKSVSVNRRSDGYFDAVGRTLTTTIATATFTAIVGSAWDEVTTTVWKWGLTEAEVTAFVGGYSASETGKRKSVEVNRRADGKYDAVARVVQSNSAENLTVTIAETSFSKETRVYNWGVDPDDLAALLTAFESATARSRKAVNVSRRQDGNYDVVLSTTATTERAGATTKVLRGQSSTVTSFVNAAAPPDPLSGYGTVHYEQNELGGYDGYTEDVTYTSTDDDDAGAGSVNQMNIVTAYRIFRIGGVVKRQPVTYVVGRRSTRSYRKAHVIAMGPWVTDLIANPDAVTVVDTTYTPLIHTLAGDSRVESLGGGRFVGIRVMDEIYAGSPTTQVTLGEEDEPA